MPQLTLSIQYTKNTDFVFNSIELKNLYFTGIDLKDQYGNPIPEETINFYIEAAQKEVSDFLSIKLKRMVYEENRDYVFDDWIQWGYVPTTYSVVQALSLKGYQNTSLQINYPAEWLKSKRQSPDEDLFHRSISLVPISGATASIVTGNVYVGVAPYIGYFGSRLVPNYWTFKYITGFNRIPADILKAIGQFAAINLFINLSDIITGFPGVASKSIGLDGLSQSITSTASSGKLGFGARIDAYRKELQNNLPRLESRYKGITFGVC